MSSKGLKSIIRHGVDVLRSDIEGPENTIMVQLGDANAGPNASGTAAEWWQQPGFASMPSDVTGEGSEKEAAQVIAIPRSDYDICIAARDLRCNSIYGQLKPGETCIYGGGSDGNAQGRMLIKQDGSVTLYTTVGNTPGATGIMFQLDASGDVITATNSTGSAMQLNSEGSSLFSSNGAITITGAGIQVASKGKVNISGTNVILGGAGAQAVLTVADLPAIFSLISQALAAVGVGLAAAGPAGAAVITSGQAGVIAAASNKRTSAE